MNYIDDIFTRADIQQIRAFLLLGVRELSIDPRTFVGAVEAVSMEIGLQKR